MPPNAHQPDPMRPRRARLLAGALILSGCLVFLGAMGSCASDTQPNPPGWLGVAPRSWAPFLLLLSLTGLALAVAGVVLLGRPLSRPPGE